MAKIRVVERDERYTVSIQGPLRASDLRRLERACGKALELEVLPLLICLDAAASDAVALAYLDRLRARGAVIRPPDVLPSRSESDRHGARTFRMPGRRRR